MNLRILVLASWLISALTEASAQDVATTKLTPYQPSASSRKESKRLLKDVLTDLEKRYNVHFLYEGTVIENRLVVFSIQRKDNLELVLQRILTSDLRYRRVDQTIYAIIPVTESTKTAPAPVRVIQNQLDEKVTLPAAINLTGTVTEQETGNGLPGVSVVVKGTTTGTTTNSNGQYQLNVPEGAVLVFSFVGYLSQEVAVANQTVLNVAMQTDSRSLSEVVVIGYGSEKKVNVIGSIAQISTEKIASRPTTRVANVLTGQMPGVTVIQRSGKPGGDSDGIIRVRGVGSFGATPGALILVDGIPGSLSELNPADIESISVLKDASSAAIYGARSANGVVLVTTKKGTSGKLKVNYTEYLTLEKPTAFPDLANSWEYAEMYNIAVGNNTFTPEVIAKYRSMNDLDNYPNSNYLKSVFSRNGLTSGRTISVSGGPKSNQYFLSAGMLNQTGLIEKNDYKRYNIRLNTNSELGSKVNLITRMAASSEQQNEPLPIGARGGNSVEDGIVTVAARWGSTWLDRASNGDYGLGQSGNGNPVSWLASQSYRRRPLTKVSLNARLNYAPVKGLTLSLIGGYNFSLLQERRYKGSQQITSTVFNPIATLYQQDTKIGYQTVQALAEYAKQYKAHNFKILAGYSFESEATEQLSGFRQDFPSNNYTVLDIGGPNNQQANGNDFGWAIQSYFSRLKYQYKDKYLFEATVRHDGSSRFSAGRKYGTFPSLAAGWRISEENFFKPLTSWFSNLKLKTSWGILGNQNIGNYPYQSTLASGRDYAIGTGMSTGAAYTEYKDPNIHWESTRSTDVGIETDFFNGRMLFNLTYFNRNTYDVLYKPVSSISSVLGVNVNEINTGKLKNTGWEVEVGYRNKIGKVRYQAQGLLSIINNELVSLGLGNVTQPNGLIGNGSNLFVGYPIEMYYGYKTDGVFLNQQEVGSWANQTKINPKAVPGDLRYLDISGPNGVPDGVVDPAYDQTYLGSNIPKYNFSLNFGLQYKGFDFSALLQGVAGVKGRLDSHAGIAFFNNGTIQRWQMEGRFNPEDPQRYPKYPRLEVVPSGNLPNYVLSDFWVRDASYIRIKNLQLGYTFPANLFKGVPIEKLRLSFSTDNLYTFKKYPVGWDPEINTGGSFYPILSSYTFSLNASF
ncbi:SusC/RagA family TonB-linked outer membrane protein [Spirosoma areae]